MPPARAGRPERSRPPGRRRGHLICWRFALEGAGVGHRQSRIRRRRVPRGGGTMNTANLTLETVEGTGLRFRVRAGSGTGMVLDSGPGLQAPSPIEALIAAL